MSVILMSRTLQTILSRCLVGDVVPCREIHQLASDKAPVIPVPPTMAITSLVGLSPGIEVMYGPSMRAYQYVSHCHGKCRPAMELLTSICKESPVGLSSTIAPSNQVHSLSLAVTFFFDGLFWNKMVGPEDDVAVAAAVKGCIWTLLIALRRTQYVSRG